MRIFRWLQAIPKTTKPPFPWDSLGSFFFGFESIWQNLTTWIFFRALKKMGCDGPEDESPFLKGAKGRLNLAGVSFFAVSFLSRRGFRSYQKTLQNT